MIKQEKLNNYVEQLQKIVVSYLDNGKYRYNLLVNKLELLNPLNILNNGYSLVSMNGKIIKSSKDVKEKDVLEIRLHEGKIKAIVSERE